MEIHIPLKTINYPEPTEDQPHGMVLVRGSPDEEARVVKNDLLLRRGLDGGGREGPPRTEGGGGHADEVKGGGLHPQERVNWFARSKLVQF